MRHPRASPRPASTALARGLFVAVTAAACGSVPVDPGPRIFPAQGVIRGSVAYQGPRPCSRDGHIVGNAIVLVFDRLSPPPPNGVASTAVNFVAVTGDVLFAGETRSTGADLYCPLQAGFTETIAASAPFEVAPVAGGSYEIRAFFDYTGDFLPEFSIRDLPEQGDIAGGAIDTADALKPVNAGNPNYQPVFVPIEVGAPQPLAADAAAGTIPAHVVPDTGFVADDVAVTIAAPLPAPRPYFFPQGEQLSFDFTTTALAGAIVQSSDLAATDATGIEGAAETDPDSLPVLTIPQDIEVPAPPANVSPASVSFYESAFPHVRLAWGVPTGELARADAPPFDLQVAPFGQAPQGTGFLVWQNATLDAATQRYVAQPIPEGNGVPQLWPQVVFQKLADPLAATPAPVVVLQGITLLGGASSDSLLGTIAASQGGSLFDPASGRPTIAPQDHLTVVLRPSVICFPSPVAPGTLVTPHPTATTADLDCSSTPCVPDGAPGQPIAPPDLLDSPALAGLVGAAATGCLPMGRYAVNVVYPDGQAWTVPNEAGVCAAAEGAFTTPPDYANLTCSIQKRPVLFSQGSRAVVEVVAATDPAYCVSHPVPEECVTAP
jgi:hypothetical protein